VERKGRDGAGLTNHPGRFIPGGQPRIALASPPCLYPMRSVVANAAIDTASRYDPIGGVLRIITRGSAVHAVRPVERREFSEATVIAMAAVGVRRLGMKPESPLFLRGRGGDGTSRASLSGLEPARPPGSPASPRARDGEAPQAPPVDQRTRCPSHASPTAISFVECRFANCVDQTTAACI
jgi:hypothetical protein